MKLSLCSIKFGTVYNYTLTMFDKNGNYETDQVVTKKENLKLQSHNCHVHHMNHMASIIDRIGDHYKTNT